MTKYIYTVLFESRISIARDRVLYDDAARGDVVSSTRPKLLLQLEMSTRSIDELGLRVGQRFECDGHKGTIKFVGKLEKSKNPDAIYAGGTNQDISKRTTHHFI